MNGILNGMTEMALTHLLWQIVEAEVDASGMAEAVSLADPVATMAWRDAADALLAMADEVENARDVQRAENERMASSWASAGAAEARKVREQTGADVW